MAGLPRTRPCVRTWILNRFVASLAFAAAPIVWHLLVATQVACNSARHIQAPSNLKRIGRSVSDHIGVCVYFVAVAFSVGEAEPVRLGPSVG